MGRLSDHHSNGDVYPESPGWTEPTTSRATAKAVGPKASAVRDAVLAAVVSSAMGLTADEASEIVGCKQSYGRPRMSELRAAGKVVPAGRRKNSSGLSAIVWRVA